MADRLKGYLAALNTYHLEPRVLKLSVNLSQQEYLSEIRKYFGDKRDFDAVFLATNYLTVNALEFIKMLQIRIPDSSGVVAYDDNDLFKLF